jgi:hypothetical protein
MQFIQISLEVDYRLCIARNIHQQRSGHKIKEEFRLGVRKPERLNSTAKLN